MPHFFRQGHTVGRVKCLDISIRKTLGINRRNPTSQREECPTVKAELSTWNAPTQQPIAGRDTVQVMTETMAIKPACWSKP